MGRHGSTKEEILKLISEGNGNLSIICKRLNLAPSTVSKHLHDLEINGIIRQRSTHLKKWKYYDLNPKMDAEKVRKRGITISKALIVSSLVIGIVIVLSLYITSNSGNSANPGVSYIPISITDPPQVPPGTQALYINYSSLMIQVEYGNSTEWLNLNSSGRLDLMSLINESQVIGLAGIKPNSSIKAITFNITSSTITVDNVTYAVYVPVKHVMASLNNSKIINMSSGLLIDFTPVITIINTRNLTLFVLVPALKATVLSSPVGYGPNQISRVQLTFPIGKFPIEKSGNAFFSTPPLPNLTVTNSSLDISGNSITFSTTLSNDGSRNITIVNLQIRNNTTSQFSGSFVVSAGSGSMSGGPNILVTKIIRSNGIQGGGQTSLNYGDNLSTYPAGYTNIGNDTFELYKQLNSSVVLNASAIYSDWIGSGANQIRITLPNPTNNIIISGLNSLSGPGLAMAKSNTYMYALSAPQGINFVVKNNATISPSSQFVMLEGAPNKIGYILPPHSSVKLSYNGVYDAEDTGVFASGNYMFVIFTDSGVLQTNITT